MHLNLNIYFSMLYLLLVTSAKTNYSQLIIFLLQTKTTLCKTQRCGCSSSSSSSSMACTSFCSCQGSEECFNVHTK